MILLTALLLAATPVPPGEQDFLDAERVRSSQPLRARTLYERAARYGHPRAQATLGMMLFSDGNRIGALRWLKAASDQGEPRGMLLWGTALFNGDGTAMDRVQGYSLVARAAKAGLGEAESTRGEMELVMTPAERGAAARLLAPQASAKQAETPAKAKPEPRAKRSKVAATQMPATTAQAQPSGGAWKVQLGAFRVTGAPQALWRKLSPRLPGKQPTYRPMGNLTGLLVGPYASRADAQAACRALGPAQPCVPVAER